MRKEVQVDVIGIVGACKRCEAGSGNAKAAASALRSEGVEVEMNKIDIISKDAISRYGAILSSALKFGAYLAKQILLFFIAGLIALAYVEAYLPEDNVGTYLTGVGGFFIASVLGGPLYTPALVEIVIGRGLRNLGMSKGALLAWLMGQPYGVLSGSL